MCMHKKVLLFALQHGNISIDSGIYREFTSMLQKRNFQEKLQMTALFEGKNQSPHWNDKPGIYKRLKLTPTNMCIFGYLIFVILFKHIEVCFHFKKTYVLS